MEMHDIVHKLKNSTEIMSAEQIKYEYVLPTLQSLGYNIFNTSEVRPSVVFVGGYMDYVINIGGNNIFSVMVVRHIEDKDETVMRKYWALNDGSILTMVTDGNNYEMYIKTFAKTLTMKDKIKLSKADAEQIHRFKQYGKENVLGDSGIGGIKNRLCGEYISILSSWARGEREVPKFLVRYILDMTGLRDNEENHKMVREKFAGIVNTNTTKVENKTPVVLDVHKVKEDNNAAELTATTDREEKPKRKRKDGSSLGRTPSLETWYGRATYQTDFAKEVHISKFGGRTNGEREVYEEGSADVTVANKSETKGVIKPTPKINVKEPRVFKKPSSKEETVDEVLARAASRRGLEEDDIESNKKLKSVGAAPEISNVPSISNNDVKRITMRKEVNYSRVIANADMYNNGTCVLKCGAKIVKEADRDDKEAVQLRKRHSDNILGDTLLSDIEFKGLRDATAFVCGFYDYQYADWRTEDGKSINVEEIGGIE